MRLLLNLIYGDYYSQASSIIAGSVLSRYEGDPDDSDTLWANVYDRVFREIAEVDVDEATTGGDLVQAVVEAFNLPSSQTTPVLV